MAVVALPILIVGLAIVAASRGLIPGLVGPFEQSRAWLATGGAMTMIGIAVVGFGLPLFRI